VLQQPALTTALAPLLGGCRSHRGGGNCRLPVCPLLVRGLNNDSCRDSTDRGWSYEGSRSNSKTDRRGRCARPSSARRPAIRASLESLFKDYSVRESRTLEEVEVHGSWAFTRGSYRSVLIPKDRRPAVEESGKYLEIFEARGPGSVEVLQNIWNSDR